MASERNADEAVAAFRTAYADLLSLPADGIVYGRSATQLTYDFSRHLAKTWRAGDEIVVSQLDHDANVRPWVQAAEQAGITVRWLPVDPKTADLELGELDDLVTDRTRLVAVTGASNLLGTRPQLPSIADRAHAVGALLYVDGVHHAAHTSIDVPALGADFYVCSPYKFFGPHCAVLGATPGAAGDDPAGQVAAVHRRGARTLRVRHAALRDHGRGHRRGRLRRLARPGRDRL